MLDKQLYIDDLAKLISKKSVQGAPRENAPFGAEVKAALDLFLEIVARMGFTAVNHDNHIGELTCGEGEEFGIIGHLDVVPAGDGWHTDPYTLTLKDGKYYGRGTTDDKGPTLLCLYALKELKDGGAKFNKKVRFFVGCNEESGWADVEHYKKNGGTFPKWGFSPDGDFPVVYAEKGPNRVVFHLPYAGKFKNLSGGTVVNAVCAYACANGPTDPALLQKHGLKATGDKIESFGKSAHGSMPELGKNAILPLLRYMADCGENVGALIDIFEDKAGITAQGNETGMATISPDLVSQTDGEIVLTADFRVPARMKAEDFFPIFDKMNVKYEFFKNRDPLYVPKDSETVQKLMKAYNEATGQNLRPISQRGATFASVFECGTAFGPEFPGEESSIHQPDEFIKDSDIDLMYDIYFKGIKAVTTE